MFCRLWRCGNLLRYRRLNSRRLSSRRLRGGRLSHRRLLWRTRTLSWHRSTLNNVGNLRPRVCKLWSQVLKHVREYLSKILSGHHLDISLLPEYSLCWLGVLYWSTSLSTYKQLYSLVIFSDVVIEPMFVFNQFGFID